MPRKSKNANGGAVVSVDTDQADPKKAVQRMERGSSGDDDEGLPAQEDDGISEQERRHSQWLERNRAVNKRIARMQRVFDQRFADHQAETQRELRTLRKENQALKTRRGEEPATDTEHETQMTALQQQMEKAMEEGNSAQVAKLQREIARKEAAFWAAKQAAITGGNDRRGAAREEPDPDEAGAAAQAQVRKPSKEGIAFTDANEWWDDPDFRVERAAANAIHAQLVEDEGSDPASEEHYARVAKRLHDKFPDLEVVAPGFEDEDLDELDEDELGDSRGQRRASKRATRAPVQSQQQREDNPSRAARRGTHLSESDLQFMRSIGMNPDNENHLIAFANGRREADQAERERRGR